MIQKCPNCSKSSGQFENFLYDTMEGYIDNAESIEFSQWTTTDRSTLTNESCQAYINLVVLQLNKLVPHS